MRVPIWGAAVLLGLLVPGCFLCPKAEAITLREQWDSPEVAFETFRTALKAGEMKVFYKCFSERFKEEYGITQDLLNLGYITHRSKFDDLLTLLEQIRIKDVEKRYVTRNGYRYAVLKVSAGEAYGVFVMLDVPSWSAKLQLEGYTTVDESTHWLKRGGFSEIVRVDEGVLHVTPLDLRQTGISDVSEVVGLTVSHRWLIDSIEQLVNLDALLEQIKSEGARP